MTGKGGSAQARRRARRAAARKSGFSHGPAATAVVVDEVETIDVDEFRSYVGYVEPVTLAVGDVAWAPETGFQDLICDLNTIMNPAGDWDFPLWICDVATDLSKVLIANWEGDYGYYVAPLSIDADKEPVLAPRSEWVDVEMGWVQTSEESLAANLRTQLAARALRDGVQADAGTEANANLTFTLTDFTIGTAAFTSAASNSVATFEGATDPDIPVEHQEQETLPDDEDDDELISGSEGTGQASMQWTATIVPEGSPTDDGRIFAPGAVTWRELPLSLGAMFDTPHADVVTASPVIGRIDEIWRDGSMVYASGVFDNSDLGREVARMVNDGTLRGISVDIAVSKMEIAWKSEVLDENGSWKGGDGPSGEDGPDLVDILFESDPDDQVMYVVWEGKIGAVTVCPFPAFAEATIKPAASLVAAASDMIWTVEQQAWWRVTRPSLVASAVAEVETPTGTPEGLTEALVASVDAPVTPPSWWFDDPELHELTSLTLEDDGRIYGHAAPWDTCHIGIPGVCTTAPPSESGYAYFHLKEVECDGGERVSCGTITLGTGHANRNLGRSEAAAHYDNTGSAVADVVCGEDEHGIWYAGALRPGLTEETIREVRGAAVSGDWRGVNGNLEFVALLAVNVPGFPVPKVRAMVASGVDGFEVLSLTAAGIHTGQEGLTRTEQARFAALRDVLDGGWDDLTASVEE